MHRLSLILLAILLSTLACISPQVLREKQFAYQRSVPECHTEKECELKWSAARSWVLSNASRKIQHLTNDFIETYNPAANSSEIAARVTKEPLTAGGYRILVKVWCDNIFGCSPNEWDAMLQFNHYVNGAAIPR